MMGNVFESRVFSNDAPEPAADGVPTCTAALRCLTCREMILATWREGENMAPSIRPIFDEYRRRHHTHPGFQEALPEFGAIPKELAPANGSTRFDRVGLDKADCELRPLPPQAALEPPPPSRAPRREERPAPRPGFPHPEDYYRE
jgi:hypothetical protein